MDLLARREHSRLELLRKLERRIGESANTADLVSVVDALGEEGLQSDERFAVSFTRERLLRGHGPRRIRSDLELRGLDESLIEAALADVPAEEGTTWQAQARAVMLKRFGASPASDYPERARRMRFLDQRGFSTQHMPRDLFDD